MEKITQKNKMERDRDRWAKVKCQILFECNGKCREKNFNIKVCEWVGGGTDIVTEIWSDGKRRIKIIWEKELKGGKDTRR